MNSRRLALVALCLCFTPGVAEARKTPAQMMAGLDPNARLEQRCNAAGLERVSKDHPDLKPDELVAYSFADTQVRGDHLKAPGAAIRSGRTWYRLTYACETSTDRMEIRSFSYTLGEIVPNAQWAEHFLVAP